MKVVQRVVVSLFPGIDILGLAFEQEGYCVLRGPDPLLGQGRAEDFHLPPDVAWGVIGGPPCQTFSEMGKLNALSGTTSLGGDLVPHFCRLVQEAQPVWWLMENVVGATEPGVTGYARQTLTLQNRALPGEEASASTGPSQRRTRRFWFGTKDGRRLDLRIAVLPNSGAAPTVLAGHGPARGQRTHKSGYEHWPGTVREMCLLQGLPATYADVLPFTTHGKRRVIGNAVPLYMGRELARAIGRVYQDAEPEEVAEPDRRQRTGAARSVIK